MTKAAGDDVLTDLDLDPNEASGLLRVGDPALLAHFGWDRGFWAVLDEMDVAECVVLIGHGEGQPLDSGWSVERLKGDHDGDAGMAKDAEAVAAFDGQVYVFGSHHGDKVGPLLRRVQWVARFDEASVAVDDTTGVPGARIEVAADDFRLHRLLNDALRDSDLELLPMRQLTRTSFIDGTMADLEGTPEEGCVLPDDWALNIEGADFTSGGSLLLGLRFPVTAEGFPIVVQLGGWERLFEGGLPDVEAIWAIDAVGRNGTLAGVRDLCTVGDELHVVSGDLDSAGKGSVIRKDYPDGTETMSTHFVTRLEGSGGGKVGATAIKEFPDNPRIEGIAADADGRFFYVSDEDEYIAVRSTPLQTGPS